MAVRIVVPVVPTPVIAVYYFYIAELVLTNMHEAYKVFVSKKGYQRDYSTLNPDTN
jgi:hypothetical protein